MIMRETIYFMIQYIYIYNQKYMDIAAQWIPELRRTQNKSTLGGDIYGFGGSVFDRSVLHSALNFAALRSAAHLFDCTGYNTIKDNYGWGTQHPAAIENEIDNLSLVVRQEEHLAQNKYDRDKYDILEIDRNR